MDSIDTILKKIKSGASVELCDIYQTASLDGNQGADKRLAALIAWTANSAGSDSADVLLSDIKALIQGLTVAGRFQVEPLGALGASWAVAVTGSANLTFLTPTCRRVRVTAVGADICIRAGAGAVGAAVNTDHIVLAGTSMDFAVPENSKIGAIRQLLTNGTLYITELLPVT